MSRGRYYGPQPPKTSVLRSTDLYPTCRLGLKGTKGRQGPLPLPQLRALDPQVPWPEGSRNDGWVETPL